MNFNDPVEVTEIFRIITIPQPVEGEPKPENDIKEYARKCSFGWEDIKTIREYAYPEDWINYRGQKFNLRLSSHHDDMLILGDYHSFYQHWRTFRNNYPLFVQHDSNTVHGQNE